MTKVCTVCKLEKDVLYFSNHNRSKDGIRNTCKECFNNKQKEKTKVLLDYLQNTGKKVCNSCNIQKNICLFGKYKLSKDGYHYSCKECINKDQIKSREKYKNKQININKTEIKICSICEISKFKSEFNSKKDRASGVTSECKLCRNKIDKLKKRKDPTLKRSISLKKYWPNLERKQRLIEFNNLMEKQNYKCKICKVHQYDLNQKLSVDHCHSTGKVRGLLCSNCNFAIGHLKNSEDLLLEAIKYLKESKNN